MDLRLAVNERGRNSIPFYIKWRSGARTIKDLTVAGLRELSRYIDPVRLSKMENAIAVRARLVDNDFLSTYLVNGCFKPLEKLSSKQIREARSKHTVIREFKIGMVLTRTEALSWGLKLSKVNSVRLRNTLLRVAHGEIYTKEKLFRFGMVDTPKCPRCHLIENLQHKFIECDYDSKIWKVVQDSCKTLLTVDANNYPPAALMLGGYLESSPLILTIYAEVLQRILMLKDDENYLLHPRHFAKNAINLLIKREKKTDTKSELKSVLEAIERTR